MVLRLPVGPAPVTANGSAASSRRVESWRRAFWTRWTRVCGLCAAAIARSLLARPAMQGEPLSARRYRQQVRTVPTRGGLHSLAGINRARTPSQSHGRPCYRLISPAAQFRADHHQTDKAGRRGHKRILQTVGGNRLIVQCNSPLTLPCNDPRVQFRASNKTAKRNRRTGCGVGHPDCEGQRRIQLSHCVGNSKRR